MFSYFRPLGPISRQFSAQSRTETHSLSYSISNSKSKSWNYPDLSQSSSSSCSSSLLFVFNNTVPHHPHFHFPHKQKIGNTSRRYFTRSISKSGNSMLSIDRKHLRARLETINCTNNQLFRSLSSFTKFSSGEPSASAIHTTSCCSCFSSAAATASSGSRSSSASSSTSSSSSSSSSSSNSSSRLPPPPTPPPPPPPPRSWFLRGSLLLGAGTMGAAAAIFPDDTLQIANSSFRMTRSLLTFAGIGIDYKRTLKGLEVGDPEREQPEHEVHLRSAQKVLDLCSKSSGLYIKLGQAVAAMNHVLPSEWTETLSVLREKAPTMDFETVCKVIEEDLGAPPSELFREFDSKPLAAASLAQVHRAVTKDGQEVAVKVQFPHLRRDFGSDMLTHHLILLGAEWWFKGFELAWMHDEVESNLVKELDFECEARNAERTAFDFRDDPNVHVPAIMWPLTSKRVLTMEFIHGNTITDLEGLKEIGVSVPDAVGLAVRTLSKQLFSHGFVHCDPHPGNLFVRPMPGGKPGEFQLVVLDHGLYRELEPETRQTYCELWRALILRQDDEVKRLVEELGVDPERWYMFALIVLMRPYHSVSAGFPEIAKMQKEGKLQADLDDESKRPKGDATDEKGKAKASRRRNAYNRHHRRKPPPKGSPEELEYQEARRRRRLWLDRNLPIMMKAMKDMPRELFLTLRSQNYVRALNYEMGSPVNRFRIMAREAVAGATIREHSPEEIAFLNSHTRLEAWAAQEQLARGSLWNRWLHKWEQNNQDDTSEKGVTKSRRRKKTGGMLLPQARPRSMWQRFLQWLSDFARWIEFEANLLYSDAVFWLLTAAFGGPPPPPPITRQDRGHVHSSSDDENAQAQAAQ